ncbi:alanyl-tRNA synthetase [Methylacidimicrobium cyclopophantes]|uniref:Alanine--tRNA ligase n=1 Tax=Methylacidimicrobium cyclopophantes TaxID=1041766 RepID=A0A5E6MH74_9BACT|nr:alanine--tRNA ligase [Methylacidimicrobium cyclopophantes]VVM08373.1 alanyl-tRNA synthetase [Methylacidimicrobium cyclopophantes]
MTSSEIRESFLRFFRERAHTIVPSAPLLPDSPNLLFTNAGMNQFVPIFLGQVPCPYSPPRAADTQKCIRAGGKHNDLEEVGFDTYHHTFFEMLGNWSFGDYFKKEAISWAWELLTHCWGFPPTRLYATVYEPGPEEPGEFDAESHAVWSSLFAAAGCDPEIHVAKFGKADNFWMMGETGPCGPCSEVHVDLTPEGKSRGRLLNQADPRCLEVWNLVFIQYDARGDGSLSLLPARHVDTGMGLERIASIVQGTQGFRDFSRRISNYDTDLFRPLLRTLEKLSGRPYGGAVPEPGGLAEQADVAFRVIVDHFRALAFAIADGILPSNVGRGYVLRRILRRATRFGRTLGLRAPFLPELLPALLSTMGEAFPELVETEDRIASVLAAEETLFAKTLERGLALFEDLAAEAAKRKNRMIAGEEAFLLYDTYGFPLDLTELMARERGLSVDTQGFAESMEKQRNRSAAAREEDLLSVAAQSEFVGYEELEAEAEVVLLLAGNRAVFDRTPFYAEMGGQIGDSGTVEYDGRRLPVRDTTRSASGAHLHRLEDLDRLEPGCRVLLRVDRERRKRIAIHHTATHLLHWALREVLGPQTVQRGSYVGPDRLRFDFSHTGPLSAEEIARVEKLVQERIAEDEPVSWEERRYAEVKNDPRILQFFGEKYGERVRVVSIGECSRELCGGTHIRHTGEIGFWKILSETGVAAGIRRIEAAGGAALLDSLREQAAAQENAWKGLQRKHPGIPPLVPFPFDASPALAAEYLARRRDALLLLERELRAAEKQATKKAEEALRARARQDAESAVGAAERFGSLPAVILDCGSAPSTYLPLLWQTVQSRWEGVAVLATREQERAAFLIGVSRAYLSRADATRLLREILFPLGGKGGGRPDLAQGGIPHREKIPEALSRARELLLAAGTLA